MRSQSHRTCPRSDHARQRGFTLVELMIVVAVVSALIGLLLPAVQKVRKELLRDKAMHNLKAMNDNVHEFFEEELGAAPELDLSTLEDFCKTHPCDPAVVRIAQGHELEGYWFDLTGGREAWHAHADPLFPGLTGDESLTIDGRGNITARPTPFADRNRRSAMHHILARGAEIVGGLLTLNPDASGSVHDSVASPEAVPQAFHSFDANGDGIVSLAELDHPAASLAPIQSFLAFVAEELKWNSSGEDLNATGVDLAALQLPAVQDAVVGPLFTYDGLCRVGSAMPHHPDLVRPFCRGLDAAQAAAERGDRGARNRILDTLSGRVAAQAGRGILRQDANALIGLLRALRAGT